MDEWSGVCLFYGLMITNWSKVELLLKLVLLKRCELFCCLDRLITWVPSF